MDSLVLEFVMGGWSLAHLSRVWTLRARPHVFLTHLGFRGCFLPAAGFYTVSLRVCV